MLNIIICSNYTRTFSIFQFLKKNPTDTTYFQIIYTIASRVYAALWIQPINLSFDLRGA